MGACSVLCVCVCARPPSPRSHSLSSPSPTVQIISTDESAAGEEVLNNRPPGGRGAPGATRTSGSLASLSGARGLTYLEYGAEDGGKPKSKKPRLTTASGKARHLLFRKRAEGRL